MKGAGITDINILSKLDNWTPASLSKFDDLLKNPRYTGILDEFRVRPDLFDKFRLVDETWWAKFPMAGICKRSGSTIPPQFKKFVGDIEVSPSGGGKLNLRDVELLDDLSPQYIGKLFDDVVTQNVSTSWASGNFSNFPSEISTYLSNLRSKGYKLVVEPHVSIAGKNPKPDLLFFGEKELLGQTISDIKYLEIKYLDDVNYTAAQRNITDNLPATVIEKNGRNILDEISGEVIVQEGQSFIINEVKKFTVDKSSIDMILK